MLVERLEFRARSLAARRTCGFSGGRTWGAIWGKSGERGREANIAPGLRTSPVLSCGTQPLRMVMQHRTLIVYETARASAAATWPQGLLPKRITMAESDPKSTPLPAVDPASAGAATGKTTGKTEPEISAEQFRQEMDALKAEISQKIKTLSASSGQPSRPSGFDGFSSRLNDFFSSGVFFILLGAGFLLLAYLALSVGVHTSFSFVLAVLGIAILLFGTGTQGMGRLDSTVATGRYTVGIAGGAGILALAIGYGMVKLGPEIQQVFELQTRYAWVKIDLGGGLCQEDARASCCTRDGGGPFEVAL